MWKELPVAIGMTLGAGALAAGNNNIPMWQGILIGGGVLGSVMAIDLLMKAIFPAYRRARQDHSSPDR